MKLSFYHCATCGKIIAVVKETSAPTICCGHPMEELIPGFSDAPGIGEKHVPVIRVDGNTVTVTVGSRLHPSETDHYIEWILLQTDRGIQQKWLKPGNAPQVEFAVMTGERVQAAYEFCNQHLLWMKSKEK